MTVDNPFPESFRKIGIIAPASPCDPEKLKAGLAVYRSWGIEPVVPENLLTQNPLPYLAAPDSIRAGILNDFFRDPSIDALICIRGGFGSPRILPMLDWDALRKSNKPIIGFSDISALHLAMTAKGAGRPMASQMAARLPLVVQSPETLEGMKRAYRVLIGKTGPMKPVGEKLQYLSEKPLSEPVSAPILASNLSLAASLCGTEYLPSARGKIVMLEDIGEPARIIDRLLNQLILNRFFVDCAAVVFGAFTECCDAAAVPALLKNFAERVPVPVFSGLAYGHDLPFVSMVGGETARVAPDGTFELACP